MKSMFEDSESDALRIVRRVVEERDVLCAEEEKVRKILGYLKKGVAGIQKEIRDARFASDRKTAMLIRKLSAASMRAKIKSRRTSPF